MKTLTSTILAVAVSASVLQSASATSLQPVLSASSGITQSATQSQQKIDKINEQVQNKLQEFRTVNKETDGLVIYNEQLEKQLTSQLEEMKQLNVDIDRVSVIERQITPLMIRMIDGLEQFIALDVPFLPEERSKRIRGLKEMMGKADVAVSEKFRRVLEAYQVEVGYGRTIEAYSGLLDVDGQERDVDFLRIGRVSLVYLSRDGSKLGRWDEETQSWQTLDADYRMHITKGLRMAKKQLAPDLLTLPIKAAS